MKMNLDGITKFASTTLVAAGFAVAVGAVHAQECLLPAHECTSEIQEDVYDGGIVDRVRFKNYCTSKFCGRITSERGRMESGSMKRTD